MKKKVEQWLADKKRKHADGVELFKACAPDEFKKKYLLFFDKKEVAIFSAEHSMLINKLTFIVQNNWIKSTEEKQIVNSEKEIIAKKEEVKTVSVETLPKDLKQVYTRIQEIAPVYAKLLAEISNEAITNDERKALSDELCLLDEERQAAWGKLDDWSNGKVVELDEKEDAFSENEFVKGIQIANRIPRIKEGIRRAQARIEQKNASAKVKASAQERIDEYTQELAELKKVVNDEK